MTSTNLGWNGTKYVNPMKDIQNNAEAYNDYLMKKYGVGTIADRLAKKEFFDAETNQRRYIKHVENSINNTMMTCGSSIIVILIIIIILLFYFHTGKKPESP